MKPYADAHLCRYEGPSRRAECPSVKGKYKCVGARVGCNRCRCKRRHALRCERAAGRRVDSACVGWPAGRRCSSKCSSKCSSNAAPMHEREPTLSGRFNLARREPLHALHCKLAAALLCWLPSALSLCLSVSLSLSCPRFGLSWASRCCNFGRLPHHHHPLPSSSFTPPSLHHRTPHPAQLRLPSTLSRIASSSLPPVFQFAPCFGSAHIRLKPVLHPQIAGRPKYYIDSKAYAASSPPSIPTIACFSCPAFESILLLGVAQILAHPPSHCAPFAQSISRAAVRQRTVPPLQRQICSKPSDTRDP